MNINKKGVTLIELVVAITIIIILISGINSINFYKLSDKQNMQIFRNDLASKYETIRNIAITGKGIGVDVFTPSEWKLEFSNSGTSILKTSYLSGGIRTNYEENSIETDGKKRKLGLIRCKSINGTNNGSITSGTGEIIIKRDLMTLSGGCTNIKDKVLELNFGTGTVNIIGEINTVNGMFKYKN